MVVVPSSETATLTSSAPVDTGAPAPIATVIDAAPEPSPSPAVRVTVGFSRCQPAALAPGSTDAVVVGASSSVRADLWAATSPPATGNTSLDSFVSTVICALGVPAVPSRLPTITTPIRCPALNVCSVGSSGIENAYCWPGLTSSGVVSELRFDESRIPRVTRHWVTFWIGLVTGA